MILQKGFTLIELIGTVVILAVISLIAFPAILNMLSSSNDELDTQTKEFVKSAALEYVSDHKDSFPNNQVKSVSVQVLLENGYLATSFICKNCEAYNDTVSVKYNGEKYDLTYQEVGGGTCPSGCQQKDLH